MRINKAELIKLGTPVPKKVPIKFSKEQQIILYLKNQKQASALDIDHAVRLSGHTKEILANIEYKKLIKGRTCECGYSRIYTLS